MVLHTEEDFKNRIAKRDIYYHTDAHGFFRIIERGPKYSLCTSLAHYFSDATTTSGRHIIENDHIEKFMVQINDMDDLLKFSTRSVRDEEMGISHCVKIQNEDLCWYWVAHSESKQKDFVINIKLDTNELPEEMKFACLPDCRPDIAKRLQTIEER